MRHASKMHDAPMQPIRLKQRLAEAGWSHGWLAKKVTEKGYKISRITIFGVINKQYKTKEHERLVKLIEEVLKEHKVSTSGIWSPLPGAEQKEMRWQIHNRASYQYRSRMQEKGGFGRAGGARGSTVRRRSAGVTPAGKEVEMNITKAYLDDDVLRHFGLKDDPFFDIVDFQDIWISPKLKVVERQFVNTIKRHGIMAVIGDIGAGKTTFLRHTLQKVVKDQAIKVIHLDRMDRKMLNGTALSQTVIAQLGGQRLPKNGVERDAMAKKLLEDNVRSGVNPVLILDEAHDLREEAYIALKRLWDSGMIFKCLSIILVGQGGTDDDSISYGLKDKLENNPFIREFSERCYVVDLGNLNGSMPNYLDFRFKKAGGDVNKVFSSQALQILSKRADVPQLANNIAIRAMCQAYRDGKLQVTPEHVAGA